MNDVKFEIERQIVHLSGGVLIGLSMYFLIPRFGRFSSIPILLGILGFLVLPKISDFLHIHHQLMKKYERSQDIKSLPYKGAIFYGIGILAPILFLDRNMAVSVILILSIGDSFSTIIGKLIGRTKIGFVDSKSFFQYLDNLRFSGGRTKVLEKFTRSSVGQKSLEGFVGFIFTAFLGSVMFAGVPAAFLLSIIGAFIELLIPLDDNISIPWCLTVLSLVFLG